MSLAEIPPNHVRRNGQRSQPPVPPRKSRLHAGMPNDENAGNLRKPPSIQSMLRNTTETGDIGQFSTKPSRVTTSSPRRSPASNNAGGSLSKDRHETQYNSGHHDYSGQQGQDFPHQRITASNNYGNGYGYRAQHHRGPSRVPSFEDYQAHLMTQGYYNNPGINTRHVYDNGHSRHNSTSGGRPQSPYGYPTRLKRPGYRPSSPSLSELNKSMANYGPAVQNRSIRTVSPSSSYRVNVTPSSSKYVVDPSDPHLQEFSSSAAIEAKGYRSPSISSNGPSTPNPSKSLKSRASSSRFKRKQSVTNSNWYQPQVPQVSPLFYDYTEEFEGQDHLATSSSSTKISIDRSTPFIDSSTYSDVDESPDSTDIVELPSESSPRKAASQNYAPALNHSTLEIYMEGDGFTQTAPQDLSDVPEHPEKELAATEAELPSNGTQHHYHENPRHHSVPITASFSKDEGWEERHPSHKDRLNELLRGDPVDLTALIVSDRGSQGKSSLTGSKTPQTSTVTVEAERSTPETIHGQSTTPTSHNEAAITSDTRNKTTPSKNERTSRSESSPAPSFESHSIFSSNILSPTPERSIIQSNNRDRFSKILLIDKGPQESEKLAPPENREERKDSPMEQDHSSQFTHINPLGPLWRNRSTYQRNTPLEPKLLIGTLIEKSDHDSDSDSEDSEEEPELTVALRQTFCKVEDDTVRQRTASSPITLPSQLSGRRVSPSVNLRRSPAVRKSSVGLPTLPKEEYPEMEEETCSVHSSAAIPSPVASVKRAPSLDKELPRIPRKQVSLRSFSPIAEPSSSDLPFDFIPLIRLPSRDDSTSEIDLAPNLNSDQKGTEVDETDKGLIKTKATDRPVSSIASICKEDLDKAPILTRGAQSKRNSRASPHASIASRPGSRPWNLDSSYPWDDQLPELTVVMPHAATDSEDVADKPPRFKLKIHRASSSTAGTNWLRKEPLSPENQGASPSLSLDLIYGSALRRKRNVNLSVLPGQINSSHDVLQSSRQKTRFVETFSVQSPTVSLQPPSPGYEVHSCFSDDSSRILPKPSFLKRISGYRPRISANRAASMDETRSYDRGLLSSALGRSRASGRSSRQSRQTGRTSRQSRATGRSSRQSMNTARSSFRMSQARRPRLRLIERMRMWLHRRMGHSGAKERSASTPLYPEV